MLHRPAPKKTAPKGIALVLPEHLRVAKDPRDAATPEPPAVEEREGSERAE
jgi:hypothetical protein